MPIWRRDLFTNGRLKHLFTAQQVIDEIGALQTTVSGLQSGSGQSFIKKAGSTSTQISITNVATDIVSKLLNVSAGNLIRITLYGRIQNSSGATRTYSFILSIGNLTLTISASTTIANAGIAGVWVEGVINVAATNLTNLNLFHKVVPATAAGASGTGVYRDGWQTNAGNFTGSQIVKIQMVSSGTGAQTFFLHGFTIEQIPTTDI